MHNTSSQDVCAVDTASQEQLYKNQSLAPLLTWKLDGADLVPLIGDDLHALRACDKQKAPGNIHTH